jgi:hypothetical protein
LLSFKQFEATMAYDKTNVIAGEPHIWARYLARDSFCADLRISLSSAAGAGFNDVEEM